MKLGNTLLLVVACTVVVGCVSQQSHERALQEYEKNHESTIAELERLQQAVEEKQTEVLQLQDTKTALEHTVEVQDQMKEEQLAAVQQEVEALYTQIRKLVNSEGGGSLTDPLFGGEPLDFHDLAAALTKVRSGLDGQISQMSHLREQNGQLEKELSALEARLKEVERLKHELELVRKAREAQEAQLEKVKYEVLTVGEEIDRITKALEDKFGNSLVVTQHHDRLVLTMLGQVLFESGEADLTPLGLRIMKQVGQVLATVPGKNIQVEGHTDNHRIYGQLQKQYPTNWELSTARATTVLRYLIEQTGMDPKQFSATGYADMRPVMTNETEEGRAQNRRVEIVLYPERVIQGNETVATLAQ
ncbi:OmpA family protein [Candidatus Nitrospira neomarina]|uniref:OmpA family protein n=1 Tax=Candidatus Nitrospira neomarina TaxID=3020899 RepID=A0AA96GFM1_9BACT|nr:OmpA family protein [Candidatus Nitrospira neomarina]WNM61434.1 OmpA family protein [Candidatus Nitrospira neomarina]